MILIIGGAYSGKLTFAKEQYSIGEDALFDLENGLPPVPCRALRHLESYTRRCAQEGMPATEAFAALLKLLTPDAVVISREVGCGIVPMDAGERAFRELHGQVLSALAERADSVIRIFCGIPEVLK